MRDAALLFARYVEDMMNATLMFMLLVFNTILFHIIDQRLMDAEPSFAIVFRE